MHPSTRHYALLGLLALAGCSTSTVTNATGDTTGGSGGITSMAGASHSGGSATTSVTSLTAGNGPLGGSNNNPQTTSGQAGGNPVIGTGGSSSGGAAAEGGAVATGGAAVGGAATGGAATGGAATGGAATGGAATGGAATGGAATGGAAFGGCPGNGPPTMVALPEGYCIDSTEVTRGQYSIWLQSFTSATLNAAIAAQNQTTCGWNTSFNPSDSYPSCVASAQCTTNCDNRPQRCVDWCDAVAYCTGVGKRLCGKIGGGPTAYGDYANSATSQWYNACSSHGLNAYPYGNTYQSTYCNGPESTQQSDQSVKSFSQCQAAGSYAGVFDLSGNVKEYQDSCLNNDPAANCIAAGGAAWTWYMASSSDFPSYMACGNLYYNPRNAGSMEIGFRCCSP